MVLKADGGFASAQIPGVDGAFSGVDLFLHDPVGSKTGKLLPTGSPVDDIGGDRVSSVDIAVPMVIVEAASLGKTSYEPITELEADPSHGIYLGIFSPLHAPPLRPLNIYCETKIVALPGLCNVKSIQQEATRPCS